MNTTNKGCLITLAVIVIIGIISALATDIYTGFGIFLLLCCIAGLIYLLIVACSGGKDTVDWMLNRRKPKR